MAQPMEQAAVAPAAPAWRQRVQYVYLRLIKPLMIGLLSSRLHGLVSHNIMLLTFTGRRSGKSYRTPVSYIREGHTLTFATPRYYGWWKNLRAHEAVSVLVQGETLRGRAVVMADDLDGKVARIRQILQLVPRDAKYYPVRIDPDGVPDPVDLLQTAREHVVVVVELSEEPPPTRRRRL